MSGTVIEHLIVKLSADAAAYRKDMDDTIKHATDGMKLLEKQSAEMVATVEKELAKVAPAFEQHVAQPAQRAAAQVAKARTQIEADAAAIARANAAYHATPPPAQSGIDDLFAGARARLQSLQNTRAEIDAAAIATNRFNTAMMGLGTALTYSAPILGIWNANAGLAAFGIGQITTACPAAGAAAATFSGAVYGVTYALRGAEAANNSFNDTLELGKIILAGATFGYADYTEATRLATEGEKALQSQMASGQTTVQRYIQERSDLMQGLVQRVNELKDVSEQAESKFVASYTGALGQRGIHGRQLEAEGERARGAFRQRRVDDLIVDLIKQADALSITKEQQIAETLATNNANEADRARVASLQKLIATLEAKKKAEHDAALAAKRAAHEAEMAAKRAEADAKREAERIKAEGKHLAESLMTPVEKHIAEIQRIQKLFAEGAINVVVRDRAIAKADKNLADANKQKAAHHLAPRMPDASAVETLVREHLGRQQQMQHQMHTWRMMARAGHWTPLTLGRGVAQHVAADTVRNGQVQLEPVGFARADNGRLVENTQSINRNDPNAPVVAVLEDILEAVEDGNEKKGQQLQPAGLA